MVINNGHYMELTIMKTHNFPSFLGIAIAGLMGMKKQPINRDTDQPSSTMGWDSFFFNRLR
jgi:hypothetical protein